MTPTARWATATGIAVTLVAVLVAVLEGRAFGPLVAIFFLGVFVSERLEAHHYRKENRP